jgi:hypothetical protein
MNAEIAARYTRHLKCRSDSLRPVFESQEVRMADLDASPKLLRLSQSVISDALAARLSPSPAAPVSTR